MNANRWRPRLLAIAVPGLLLATMGVLVHSPPAAAEICEQRVCEPTDPPTEYVPPKRVTTIVSMGDSYAAGEGAPRDGAWFDDDCHRSELSGVRRAVRRLSDYAEYVIRQRYQFQHIDVTCSGAQIDTTPLTSSGGLLSPQTDISNGPRQAQIDQVNHVLGNTPVIDVLTIGAGGNDAGFRKLIEACVLHSNCSQDFAAQADTYLGYMKDNYVKLIDAIQGDGNGNGKRLNARVRDVYLTLYPDPTQSGNFNFCHNWPEDPVMGNIARYESQWLSQHVIARLNGAIQEASDIANRRPGIHPKWHFINAPRWDDHGWCAPDQWTNSFFDSRNIQQGESGTAHPNAFGYAALSNVIYDALAYLNNPTPVGATFELVAAHSLKTLGIPGRPPAIGMAVGQYTWQPGNPNTEPFTFSSIGTVGLVQIKSRSSGLCLARGSGEGAPVTLGTCADVRSMRWELKPALYGSWLIMADDPASGTARCLGISQAGLADGAALTQSTCEFRPDQTWWFGTPHT